jgi:hypothetical protein
VALVGDRGLITSARITEGLAPAGLDWISCLRAPQIAALAADTGPLQFSLFDDRDLAEISSPDFPGERLVACRNPALAKERARKREELLQATERRLTRIADEVRRKPAKHDAGVIGLAVGGHLGQHQTIALVRLSGRQDLEEMAVASGSSASARLGSTE